MDLKYLIYKLIIFFRLSLAANNDHAESYNNLGKIYSDYYQKIFVVKSIFWLLSL